MQAHEKCAMKIRQRKDILVLCKAVVANAFKSTIFDTIKVLFV